MPDDGNIINSKGNGCSGKKGVEGVRAVRSDITNVIYHVEEFVFMFGKVMSIEQAGSLINARLESNVTMSPFTAKRLALLLNKTIREYEKNYGPIIKEQPSYKKVSPGSGLSSSPSIVETKKGKDFAEKMKLLVDKLDVPVGIENSFKIKKGKILPNRFLMGINKKSLGDNALNKLRSTLKDMNAPEEFLREFENDFVNSDYIHFGFEENEKGATFKAYLEFYESIKKNIAEQRGSHDHVLLHRGLKWRPENDGRSVVSDYYWFPNLSIAGMKERVRNIVKQDRYDTPFKSVKGILDLASHKLFFNDILYQDVTEKGNPRKSFDINFYRGGFKISELYPFLINLCGYYSIPFPIFLSFYNSVKNREFGHISGGVDREGQSFVTIYYGVKKRNARGITAGKPKKDRAVKTDADTAAEKQSDQNAEFLYKLVNALNVKTGFESSFKIYRNKILGDRFLMGFRRESIEKDKISQVTDICHQLNMPEDFQKPFLSSINGSNIILFGFEGGEDTLYYKAYLEFKPETKNQENRKKPYLVHIGYKWDVFENANNRTTYYTCFPHLNYKEMIEKINGLFPDNNQKYIPGLCTGIINLASGRVNPSEILFFEAKEENNPRISFDLNLYRANLKVSEIFPLLCDAATHYSVPFDKFYKLYSDASSDIFGHLTGGIDRNSRDFLTFYFGKKGSTSLE